MPSVIASTPDNAPRLIGPYSHIARVGNFLTSLLQRGIASAIQGIGLKL